MYEEKEIEEKKANKSDTKKSEQGSKRLIFKADWISVIIKLLILMLFAFLVIFVYTKIRNGFKETDSITKNIELMRVGTYNYFKEEEYRPESVTEQVTVSLAKLEQNGYANDLSKCNSEDSFASLIKTAENQYDMELHLQCSEETLDKSYEVQYQSLKNEEEVIPLENKVDSKQEEKVYYELSRNVDGEYECPDGYTLVGTKCYSTVETLSVSAIPKYETVFATNEKASYHKGETQYEYVDAITTADTYRYTCPIGYTLVGTTCQKVSSTRMNQTKRYYCNPWGTLSGTKCRYETTPVSKPATYTCSSGTLVGNNQCYVTSKVETQCKNGYYDSITGSCYTKEQKVAKYSEWHYEGIEKYTKAKMDTDKTKYILYRKVSNTYYYKIYTRKVTGYTCNKGTLVNGTCRIYNDALKQVSCSSGYSLSKDKTTCYKYTKAQVKTSAKLECPSGYTKSGSICYAYGKAGYTVTQTPSCSSGYSYQNGKCVKTVNATKKIVKGKTTCPDGYQLKTVDGTTMCAKKLVTDGYYYCANSEAVLVGDRCITESSTTLVDYYCPRGYELSGTTCYAFTDADKIRAKQSTSEETMWSESKSVSGWKWTGNTKSV